MPCANTAEIPGDEQGILATGTTKNLSHSDSIEKTGLPVEVLNALRHARINTVGAMMSLNRERMSDIISIGKKRAAMIERMQDEIRAGGYREPEAATLAASGDEDAAIFYDAAGIPFHDIPIKDLHLSRRAYRVLTGGGYDFASKLIGVTAYQLRMLHHWLNDRNIKLILSAVADIRFAVATEHIEKRSQAENACMEFSTSFASGIPTHAGMLYKTLLPIFKQSQENNEAVDDERLYEVPFLRDLVSDRITAALEDKIDGATREELISLFADTLVSECAVDATLRWLSAYGAIHIGQTIEIRRPSLWEYIDSIEKEKHRNALTLRLKGYSYGKIGQMLGGLSSGRIRQIVKGCIRKKRTAQVIIEEDKYLPIYKAYSFSQEAFSLAFGTDESVYAYMALICGKPGEMLIEQFLDDANYPAGFRMKVEHALSDK